MGLYGVRKAQASVCANRIGANGAAARSCTHFPRIRPPFAQAISLLAATSAARMTARSEVRPHEVQPAKPAVSEKPKRRWLQFSLRTMLVVMTLASVGLGWLAYERNEVRKRQEAIAAIENHLSVSFNEQR